MLDAVLNHLLFYGGSLALTMAIMQFAQIFRDSKHLWLCIFFTSISAIGFQQYYYGVYAVPDHEISLWRGQAVAFMLGPSIFFFYKRLFYNDFTFTFKHIFHFVPPFLSLCIDIFMLKTETVKAGALFEARSIIIAGNYYYLISAAVIFIIYNVYILIKEDFISLIKTKKFSVKVNQVALVYIVMVLMIAIMLLFAFIMRNITMGRIVMTLMILPFLFIFIVGNLIPELISLITSVVKKNIYERSMIKGLDVDALKTRLDDLMIYDKVYCDEDLNLKRLSEMLSITPHQLSEFLNKNMNISFNYYINRYRVDEAVNLMQTQPERSISSICYSVGFNSKSAFYEAFTKFIGKSPARYRKTGR
ncbi:MAG TPA: helix-turn-helix domain-containing protein [Spirochaetota bacterium]|nr:helix-turn-helix domain-containing protein [Spirochaetota bacterium]HPV41151.1 helix-turn-helix domain-containing protein [Spirochaetota bacterium]